MIGDDDDDDDDDDYYHHIIIIIIISLLLLLFLYDHDSYMYLFYCILFHSFYFVGSPQMT